MNKQMNIYKAVVNGEIVYCKASSEDKARVKLYHIYKKKYGIVRITNIHYLKTIKKK